MTDETNSLAQIDPAAILANIPEIESSIDVSDEAMATVETASQYLPRLQLVGSNSELFKSGKVEKAGTWCFVKFGDDVPEQLGKEIVAVVLARRPMAMHLVNNSPQGVFYDADSREFRMCVEYESVKSETESWMFGPQYLLWLPAANSGQGALCGYFMSSKTARRESSKVKALLRKAAKFSAIFINPPTSKYSWWGPSVKPYSGPIDNAPEHDKLVEAITKFLNPPKSEKEAAPEDTSGREL